MGPKAVSQMIKEEEAIHTKDQADSSQLKISTLCIKIQHDVCGEMLSFLPSF